MKTIKAFKINDQWEKVKCSGDFFICHDFVKRFFELPTKSREIKFIFSDKKFDGSKQFFVKFDEYDEGSEERELLWSETREDGYDITFPDLENAILKEFKVGKAPKKVFVNIVDATPKKRKDK